jgi:hypothetical protein
MLASWEYACVGKLAGKAFPIHTACKAFRVPVCAYQEAPLWVMLKTVPAFWFLCLSVVIEYKERSGLSALWPLALCLPLHGWPRPAVRTQAVFWKRQVRQHVRETQLKTACLQGRTLRKRFACDTSLVDPQAQTVDVHILLSHVALGHDVRSAPYLRQRPLPMSARALKGRNRVHFISFQRPLDQKNE